MNNKIERYFLDVHMSQNHIGLRAIADRDGYDVDTLQPGEFFLYFNRPFTAFKLLGAGNTFAYHRNPHDRALDPRAVLRAVETFDGSRFNYKEALAETLLARLPRDIRDALARREAREAKEADELKAAGGEPVMRKAARKKGGRK